MKNIVQLTSCEMVMAATAGIMRQVENVKAKRRPYYLAGNQRDWQIHVEGCLGEFALAKFLGIHWTGKGALRAPDVGTVDVRTAGKNHYKLILHPDDDDDRPFWLLCGVNGRYSVKGWLRAGDGKKKEYWKDPADRGASWYVPQSVLNKP